MAGFSECARKAEARENSAVWRNGQNIFLYKEKVNGKVVAIAMLCLVISPTALR